VTISDVYFSAVKRRYRLPEESAISPDELMKALKRYLQESGENRTSIRLPNRD